MKLEDLIVEDEVECLPTIHADRPMPVLIEVKLAPLSQTFRDPYPCNCGTPGCLEGPGDHRWKAFKGVDVMAILEAFDEDDD